MSEELESRIREILQATPVDQLGTITAKDVRARLISEGIVDEAWIKENKKGVNALIGSVYEEACAPLVRDATDNVPKDEEGSSYTNGGVAYSEREGTATTSQYADEDEGVDYEEYGESVGGDASTSTPPPGTKSRSHKKSKRELTDEEYARRLSSELNGRPRSSRLGKSSQAPSKSSRKSVSRTPKRNKKSAEHVDDSDGAIDEDEDGAGYDSGSRPSKKKRKKSRKSGEDGGGGAKGGFKKEYILSVPLSAVLEVDRLSRPQVVKHLWEYIKTNNLQNPSNRKEILCDDLLRPIFNADKVDMFKMNKILGQHLHEAE